MVQVAQSSVPKLGAQELSMVESDGLLPLQGVQPVSVYVRINDDATKAQFSTDLISWYSGGMSWVCGDEYALFITYILIMPNIELKPPRLNAEIWFSPVLPPSSSETYSTQLGCANPVAGTYHFRVHVKLLGGGAGDLDIDPQIVITPM